MGWIQTLFGSEKKAPAVAEAVYPQHQLERDLFLKL
jgi:hypothetical protein